MAAVNTGNNLIYLIVSALLSFMGISGFFGKNNLSGIVVDMEFPQEIYAKRDFPLKITLKNRKKLFPLFLLRLHLDGHSVFFPYIDAKGESIRRVNISFSTRGLHELKNLYVSSVFPFSFFTRFSEIEGSFPLVVFPELIKRNLTTLYERERRTRDEKPSDRVGYESDIISIREYVQGDPLKYINWKATAKTGTLKTKELSSAVFQPVLIDFERIAMANREEKISSVAYAILQFHRKNIPTGLKIAGKQFKPNVTQGHKIAMLRELALYGRGSREAP